MIPSGEQTIRLPGMHPGQAAVLGEAGRLNWLAAGRRWRKSSLGVRIAVKAAALGRERVIWGAPTFDQVRVSWDELRWGAGGVAVFNQSRMTVNFPTGGEIKFRSLDDPDNARGHSADGVIIDEAGDVKEIAYYEVLRPMLIDTGGWLWALGTPKGRNWFHREHAAALGRDDSRAWQIPTVGAVIEAGLLVRRPHPLENPAIPFAEIEAAFKTTPLDIFRQEYLAEFVEGYGAVFRNIFACLVGPTSPAEHRGHKTVAGVDWGKQQDFSAISVVCADCGREVALDRFNQVDYILQRGRLAALIDTWHIKKVVAEQNAAGEPIIEQLQRDGLPVEGFQTTATSKPPLIENLALALEKGEYKWLNDPVATGELEAYERRVSETTGRASYSAPAGMHDDTVIARALALQAVTSAPKWRTIEFMHV